MSSGKPPILRRVGYYLTATFFVLVGQMGASLGWAGLVTAGVVTVGWGLPVSIGTGFAFWGIYGWPIYNALVRRHERRVQLDAFFREALTAKWTFESGDRGGPWLEIDDGNGRGRGVSLTRRQVRRWWRLRARFVRERAAKRTPQGYSYDSISRQWIPVEDVGPQHDILLTTLKKDAEALRRNIDDWHSRLERIAEVTEESPAMQAAAEHLAVRQAYEAAGFPHTVDYVQDPSYPGDTKRPVVRPRTVPRPDLGWGVPRPEDWKNHLVRDGDDVSQAYTDAAPSDSIHPNRDRLEYL